MGSGVLVLARRVAATASVREYREQRGEERREKGMTHKSRSDHTSLVFSLGSLGSGFWPLAPGLWPLASGLWPLEERRERFIRHRELYKNVEIQALEHPK